MANVRHPLFGADCIRKAAAGINRGVGVVIQFLTMN